MMIRVLWVRNVTFFNGKTCFGRLCIFFLKKKKKKKRYEWYKPGPSTSQPCAQLVNTLGFTSAQNNSRKLKIKENRCWMRYLILPLASMVCIGLVPGVFTYFLISSHKSLTEMYVWPSRTRHA